MNTKKMAKVYAKEVNDFEFKQSASSSNIQPNIVKDEQKNTSIATNFRNQSKQLNQQDEFAFKIIQKHGLQKIDLETIHYNFKKYNTNETGKLQFHQLLSILKSMQFVIDDKVKKQIFKELEDKAIKTIEMETVCLIVGALRQSEKKKADDEKEENQSEFIDAFVALGGNPDSSGKVMKQYMLKVIKEEFDLTFDMEKIMEKIEASSQELDYYAFCMLFQNQQEDRNRSNSKYSSSVLSQINARSRKNSIASVKVKYSDFEKFCEEFSD